MRSGAVLPQSIHVRTVITSCSHNMFSEARDLVAEAASV